MIKEGTATYVDGQGPVIPFTGKYAVKDARVFDLIRAGWDRAGLADAPYRPLRIEFELTTKCNDTCPSCGMGALSLQAGRSLTDGQLDHLVSEFESIALPSVAITGGEPFVATRALLRFMDRARGTVDISKLTTNGVWGSERRCGPTFDRLVAHGLLDNRLFVPLLMVSIGEQTTPLDRVCRIIHHVVTEFSHRELNIAVSSLADPADREHKIYPLMRLYEETYGGFPHDRVHSTMRVYLENERLEDQALIHRPGRTSVAKWMDHCYDCFAPTVGAYVLPTALLKASGDLYACAAFNVPEKLRFGNIFAEPLREVIARTNRSSYVATVREGGGLKALHRVIPRAETEKMTCGSFCGSCSLLIDAYEQRTGERGPGGPALPMVNADTLWSRLAATRAGRDNACG
ncbi:4Fe-4S cluster-binding domain-containing protein [Microtetraspora malaysiensis]|uniref:4Fe-4S cluster-binding domain-containing protein n=1 Tax=Microtetraspora malaysiensis TaxID=161358 RepID=A0ABW6SXS9_9ACTN